MRRWLCTFFTSHYSTLTSHDSISTTPPDVTKPTYNSPRHLHTKYCPSQKATSLTAHTPTTRGRKPPSVSSRTTFPFMNVKEKDRGRNKCKTCKQNTTTWCKECDVYLCIDTTETGKACWSEYHACHWIKPLWTCCLQFFDYSYECRRLFLFIHMHEVGYKIFIPPLNTCIDEHFLQPPCPQLKYPCSAAIRNTGSSILHHLFWQILPIVLGYRGPYGPVGVKG